MTAGSIAAVLFDADGVLQRPAAKYQEALRALLGSGVDIDGLLGDLFAAEEPSLRGQGDFPSIVDEVLARWGCADLRSDVLRIWQDIAVDQTVLQFVAELRASGTYCALATNQNAHRARSMSDRLGYAQAFDHSFYSCDLGYTKPDPRFFRAVLDVLRCAPDQVLFIDDRQENIAAARRSGMRGALFQPERSTDSGKALRRLLDTAGYGSIMSLASRE